MEIQLLVLYSSDAHDDWLILPQLTNVEAGTKVSFWHKNGMSSWPDKYNLMLSTTTNDVSAFVVTLETDITEDFVFGNGIEDIGLVNVHIYPNPTNGEINISLPVKANVMVISSVGETILKKDVNSESTIDMSSFSDGLYYVKITTELKTVVKQIILLK